MNETLKRKRKKKRNRVVVAFFGVVHVRVTNYSHKMFTYKRKTTRDIYPNQNEKKNRLN